MTVSARHNANAEYEIEYYITNVTGLGEHPEHRIFDIDAKLGVVSTAVVLDREAGFEWYEVEVYALAVDSVLPICGITKVRNKKVTWRICTVRLWCRENHHEDNLYAELSDSILCSESLNSPFLFSGFYSIVVKYILILAYKKT